MYFVDVKRASNGLPLGPRCCSGFMTSSTTAGLSITVAVFSIIASVLSYIGFATCPNYYYNGSSSSSSSSSTFDIIDISDIVCSQPLGLKNGPGYGLSAFLMVCAICGAAMSIVLRFCLNVLVDAARPVCTPQPMQPMYVPQQMYVPQMYAVGGGMPQQQYAGGGAPMYPQMQQQPGYTQAFPPVQLGQPRGNGGEWSKDGSAAEMKPGAV